MSAKERILMLRLMEKLKKHPDFAKVLGVEAPGVENDLNTETESKGLTAV